MKSLSEHTIQGAPVFWIAPDKKSIVVDARVFTDLTRASVVDMRATQRADLGRVQDLKAPPRDVLKLLLLSHVVGTYLHIEATVTLNEERSDDARYEAACSTVHVFYTNERNESAYEFTFVLDRKTGTMAVERR